ncbi:RNA polymerase sigma factor [Sulfidibacter corallicola]|uniref:RNA polymerase sigma factor n=1 Tax=Sulfidibacter corallicola TaxID=2818388 RepID=A0A8A4TSB1_SULCO|nr:RNA polymerase sigma factor [Sulfidibacter corallicola]QTD52044.1 RNA polymerase sigma factor [Sulfidibacter corallicola]
MFSNEEFQRFYRYCLALTRDPDQASDLLHDGLVKFLAKRARVTSEPGAYFRRILRNTFIDDYRAAVHSAGQLSFDENVTPLDVASELETTLVHADTVQRLLAQVGSTDRELLFLWAVEGYTMAEIAELTEVPRGTVLARLHRLKLRLRRLQAGTTVGGGR